MYRFITAATILGIALMTLPAATANTTVKATSEVLVIAHRGASGYLPEHTLAAKALAYGMGADYLEQDVVMTQDGELVVLHDHYLDRVSNVQELFTARKRSDGRYYVIDFTLAEIRSLDISERYNIKDGVKVAVFPQRFPLAKSHFKVHTLAEEIELIQGLNQSTGGDVGIYTEVKSAGFHLAEGRDISSAVLKELKRYGYSSKTDKVYYQSFEVEELQRVHNTVMPELSMSIKLVQLLGTEKEYQPVISAAGLAQLATYADGIGPSIDMIATGTAKDLHISTLVEDAHRVGLAVHPYTFRQESFAMPSYVDSYEGLLDIFINRVGVDGLFTDFTDRTVDFIRRR